MSAALDSSVSASNEVMSSMLPALVRGVSGGLYAMRKAEILALGMIFDSCLPDFTRSEIKNIAFQSSCLAKEKLKISFEYGEKNDLFFYKC